MATAFVLLPHSAAFLLPSNRPLVIHLEVADDGGTGWTVLVRNPMWLPNRIRVLHCKIEE